MARDLIRQLRQAGPVLTDGAWGTELQRMGLVPGEFADLWNLSCPEKVASVARSYVEAGSQIILTNTFRANCVAMSGEAFGGKVEAVNRAGVEISRAAAAGKALVFASMGPSGKMLLAEEISEEELADAFCEQAGALAAAGPDALLIETMSELKEATIALKAAKETGLPVVVSMVFDSGKDLDRTITGVTPERAAKELTDQGADVIGANCGRGIDGFAGICRRLHGATDLPIWIKSNAGLPRVCGDTIVYDMTPEAFAGHTSELVNAGASFLGGCCGTNPDFIRALSRSLGELSVKAV